MDDEAVWGEITKHAEERSGEYVPADDLELQLSPWSPFVKDDVKNNYWYG